VQYDFDLFYVDNAPDFDGNVSSSDNKNFGQPRENGVLAVFRNQRTVDAVASAPPIVRLFLEEAGFGVKAPYKNDCAKTASRPDPVKRRVLVRQLTTVLSNRAMKKALGRVAQEGDFNVHDFIASVVAQETPEARAQMDDDAPVDKVMPRRPIEVRKTGARRRVRPS
jgi:hypothetical protein